MNFPLLDVTYVIWALIAGHVVHAGVLLYIARKLKQKNIIK